MGLGKEAGLALLIHWMRATMGRCTVELATIARKTWNALATLFMWLLREGLGGGARSELFGGRVLAIDLNSLQVSNCILPGLNVPVEAPGVTGFDNPDNLAKTPDGKLVIVEDSVPSDIWIAPTTGNQATASSIWLFASLTDPGAEGSGIYFGKDPKVMFVNTQHSALDDNDTTWAIVKTK